VKKTHRFTGFLAVTLMLISCAMLVFAAPVSIDSTSLGTATGTGVYTNDKNYVVQQLLTLEVMNALSATDTVTVQRIAFDRSVTNTIGTVIISANVGRNVNVATNYWYLRKGDSLYYSGAEGTGGTVVATFDDITN